MCGAGCRGAGCAPLGCPGLQRAAHACWHTACLRIWPPAGNCSRDCPHLRFGEGCVLPPPLALVPKAAAQHWETRSRQASEPCSPAWFRQRRRRAIKQQRSHHQRVAHSLGRAQDDACRNERALVDKGAEQRTRQATHHVARLLLGTRLCAAPLAAAMHAHPAEVRLPCYVAAEGHDPRVALLLGH